ATRLCLRVAEKDAAAAADVEQTVGGTKRERLEHGLPRKRVRVGAAVCLPRLLAVRLAGDPIGHPIDPPLAETVEGHRHLASTHGAAVLQRERTRPVPGTVTSPCRLRQNRYATSSRRLRPTGRRRDPLVRST